MRVIFVVFWEVFWDKRCYGFVTGLTFKEIMKLPFTNEDCARWQMSSRILAGEFFWCPLNSTFES